MQFRNIVAQDKIKHDLIRFAQNERLHHTQLFIGQPGVGTLGLVVAYVQYLLCENPTEQDSCGECNQCRKVSQIAHPDVNYTIPTITSKGISKPISKDFIKEFREFFADNPYVEEKDWLNFLAAGNKQGNITALECNEIIKSAKFSKLEGKYKINIIWMAEALAKEGNRLLKILEEPPKDTLFFLIAEDEEKILNTIISRCQVTRLQRLQTTDIVAGLLQENLCDEQKAKSIALICEGNYNNAKKLAVDTKSQVNDGYLYSWFEKIIKTKIDLVPFTEELARLPKQELKNLMLRGTQFCREIVLLRDTDLQSVMPQQEQQLAKWFAGRINIEQIHQLSTIFDDGMMAIERNANVKLLLLSMSFKIDDIIIQRGK